MIRALRVILGASIIAILLPAMSYALTGRWNALVSPEGSTQQSPVPLAGDAWHEQRESTEKSLDDDASLTNPAPVAPHPEGGPIGVVATGVDGSDANSDPSTTVAESSTTSASLGTTSSTTPPKATTSSQVGSVTAPTTSTSSSSASSEVITGDACPCTVADTVALQGRVSLQGDLLVKGGTLVARPGVDVEGNGFQIMFINGGRADFQGTKVFTWSDRGSKVNLQRDINFRNLRRIVWMGGGPSVLKYFTIADSGTPALGDYPLHWHLNGDSTRGTIVEGVVAVDSAHHAFVPHGSHGITFKDVIAKNTTGDAFWWDPPGTNESCSFQKYCTLDNSNDITYDHALADGVSPVAGSRGYRLTGFRLEAGSGNAVKNSTAINIGGKVDCSGFHWPESANQNDGGNVWVFKNNHGESNCHGIFVWQNDSNRHIIDGFTGGGIDQGAYANTYDYRNVDVPYVEIIATGWSMSNSHAGDAIAKSHTAAGTINFTNVTFDSFTVDDGAKEPATYLLNGTNLTCSDIIIESMATGSGVVIDGKDC